MHGVRSVDEWTERGKAVPVRAARQQRHGGDIRTTTLIWKMELGGGSSEARCRECSSPPPPQLPVCFRVQLLSEEICVPTGPFSQDDLCESHSVVLSIKILPQRQTLFLNTRRLYLLSLFIAECQQGFQKSQMP